MPVAASPTVDGLLEREESLSALARLLGDVATSHRGRIALVSGEAGVGKTALLRAFTQPLPRTTTVLWGACDPLMTPRPLGPFFDVSATIGGELARLVTAGARPHEIAAELRRELGQRSSTLLVLEDLHWADEATFDVLRIIGRRVDAAPVLVLVTYRDDELGRWHPLRPVLGEIGNGQQVARIQLAPLSRLAVAAMAAAHDVDASALFERTAGNPFFVTEALATGDGRIPESVRDAVLARVARLSRPARMLLDAIAIAPSSVPDWLLEASTGDAIEALDECVAAGVVVTRGGEVAFRHELARLAVEAEIGDRQRRNLHRRALRALESLPAGVRDAARLAHHAEASGDDGAVLRFAPEAAATAVGAGAHREAAAQYARALRFAGSLPVAQRADLLSRRSAECYLTGDFEAAIDARREALACYRQIGDRRRESDALRAMSSNLRCHGRVAEADESAHEALRLVESLPARPELALAQGNQAMIALNVEDLPVAEEWAHRALQLAEQLDHRATLVHALNTLGTARYLAGDPQGREQLERSLELSKGWQLDEHAGRAYIHLAWTSVRLREYGLAERYEGEGLDYCLEHGLDAWGYEIAGHKAHRLLAQDAWDEATDVAASVLRSAHTNAVARTICLSVIALIRARRGDPDRNSPLEEALAMAAPTGELQHLTLPAAAAAEIAWLDGGTSTAARVIAATEAPLRIALGRRAAWVVGELAAWRRRTGAAAVPPEAAAGPYALELAGDTAAATAAWCRLGCGYEAAVVQAASDDEEAQRQALATFQRLGARPAASLVARRLRERGVSGLPRGPRPSTQSNPARLTARELEVVGMVTMGMSNNEIARRLFVSKKTVDHHVSSILAKLAVSTRAEVGPAASRLGIELPPVAPQPAAVR